MHWRGCSHACGKAAAKSGTFHLTVARRIYDSGRITIMGVGAEDSDVGRVADSALVDMGAPEILADGVDHIEIIGSTLKWVFYTVRFADDGRPERRECVTVSMPLHMVDGGVECLRERFRGKIREYRHNEMTEDPRRMELN